MPIADFLAVILSALGVMVAILTFFLGVLAFFGWSAFKSITEEKFETLFRRHFNASDPEYGAAVKALVDDVRADIFAQAVRDGLVKPGNDEEDDPSNDDAGGPVQ